MDGSGVVGYLIHYSLLVLTHVIIAGEGGHFLNGVAHELARLLCSSQ